MVSKLRVHTWANINSEGMVPLKHVQCVHPYLHKHTIQIKCPNSAKCSAHTHAHIHKYGAHTHTHCEVAPRTVVNFLKLYVNTRLEDVHV